MLACVLPALHDIAWVSQTGCRLQVTGLDFAQQMLADAERRQQSRQATRRSSSAHVEWVQGDALELPFHGKRLFSAPGEASTTQSLAARQSGC